MNPVKIIKQWYAAPDKDLLAKEVVWQLAPHFPYAGTYHGKDAVFEQVFAPLLTRYKSWQVSVERVFDAGEMVIATGVYSGYYDSSQGKLGQLSCFVHVWQVQQGLIVSFQQYVEDNFG